jgi:hypothetical protein
MLGFQDRSFTSALRSAQQPDVMLSYFEDQRFIAPLNGDSVPGPVALDCRTHLHEANRRVLLVRLLRATSAFRTSHRARGAGVRF